MRLKDWTPKRFNATDISNAEWGYDILKGPGPDAYVTAGGQILPGSDRPGGYVLFQYGPTVGGDCWKYVRDEVGQPIVFPTWGILIAHVVETVTRDGAAF